MKSTFKLEKVIPTKNQIDILYMQLKARKYSISHKNLPTYKEHEKFVFNNPYRKWFIIKLDHLSKGNMYVQFDNSIGINGFEDLDAYTLKKLLDLLFSIIKPLAPIPSLRYKDFSFNISIKNKLLIKNLERIGYKKSQITFVK